MNILFFSKWFNNFRSKKSTNFYLLKEMLFIVVLISSIAIFFALLSFDSSDVAIIKSDTKDIHNYLGLFGASIADLLFSFFGLMAFLLPISGLYYSLRLLNMRSLISYKQLAGSFIIILSLIPVLAISFKEDFLLTGMLGLSIKKLVIYYFSHTGLYLISFGLFICGLMLVIAKPFLLLFLHKFYSYFKKSDIKKVPQISVEKEPEVIVAKNDIAIVEQKREKVSSIIPKAQEKLDPHFLLPPLQLLDYDDPSICPVDEEHLKKEATKLQTAFLQFGIEGKIREIRTGPVVTNYEFIPVSGIKLARIASLSDDIAMAMVATQVRIVAPIPGKGAVGIEVPNEKRETVYLKEIVAHESYSKQTHKLCMAIGKDVEGKPYFMNLAEMPHVLIAGTTGSGKSVSVNAMICSILYRASPKDVRFLMIDPKMLELSIYNGIPHLLLPPIIDAKKAANALKWAVKEMDLRYALMKEAMVRDIDSYNKKISEIDINTLNKVANKEHEHQPYIVIVIDEYADLLAVAGKEVESYIMRLAQKARACGIHVMLATQRPSVDVITGVIKANFPVRMGFRLASCHDSKTIINKYGAEKLLGRGDALIMPPGTSDVYRVHGAFISEKELLRVIDFWTKQTQVSYQEDIAEFSEEQSEDLETTKFSFEDEKIKEAINIIKEHNKCSISFLQRHLGVGYNRAAKIVEHMEKQKIIGPVLNSKGDREIFIE